MCFPLQPQAIFAGGHKPVRLAPEVLSSHLDTNDLVIHSRRMRGQLETRPALFKENVSLRLFGVILGCRYHFWECHRGPHSVPGRLGSRNLTFSIGLEPKSDFMTPHGHDFWSHLMGPQVVRCTFNSMYFSSPSKNRVILTLWAFIWRVY